MVDRMSAHMRSQLMARVRQSGTQPEIALRRALWNKGLRYRLRTGSRLPGRPDILFVGARVAVFVDGCFWHGCPEHGTQPKTRTEFWAAKIARNRERDEEVNAALVAMGWRVVRIWEHQLRRDLDGCVAQIKTLVKPRAGVEHR